MSIKNEVFCFMVWLLKIVLSGCIACWKMHKPPHQCPLFSYFFQSALFYPFSWKGLYSFIDIHFIWFIVSNQTISYYQNNQIITLKVKTWKLRKNREKNSQKISLIKKIYTLRINYNEILVGTVHVWHVTSSTTVYIAPDLYMASCLYSVQTSLSNSLYRPTYQSHSQPARLRNCLEKCAIIKCICNL